MAETKHSKFNIINSQVKETEPLYFKTLEANCPNELWRFVRDRVDKYQHIERDKVSQRNYLIKFK